MMLRLLEFRSANRGKVLEKSSPELEVTRAQEAQIPKAWRTLDVFVDAQSPWSSFPSDCGMEGRFSDPLSDKWQGSTGLSPNS